MRYDVKLKLNDGNSIKIRYAQEHVTPDTYFDHLHAHSWYEICIIVSGDMLHLANEKTYSLRRGDVFICRPGDLHYAVCREDSVYERFAFWLPVSAFSDLRYDVFSFMHQDLLKDYNLFRISKANREVFFKLLDSLKPALVSGKDANSLFLYGKVAEITAFLSNEAKEYVRTHPNPQPYINIPTLVNRAMIYIRDNFAHVKGVSEIADNLHINRDYLSRIFKKHTEMTIHDYLINVRLNESKIMLLRGAGVTETAFACGFNSTSYFIRVFVKSMGKTPNEFKKSGKILISEAK